MIAPQLPIDETLPALTQALDRSPFAVVEAAPGAGKTTRIPWALARHFSGQVVVSQPRRLAARVAASFVAREVGTALGDAVGYRVRFDNKSSARTRVHYVTEGVLLQQLARDPLLEGYTVAIIDEFHERHLESDQLLALLKRLCEKRANRTPLRLVVMSATLDAEPIAEFLGDCPRLRCEGRAHPVSLEHSTEMEGSPLDARAAVVTRQQLKRHPGDVLVFLPGVLEIQRTQKRLQQGVSLGAQVLPLHGQLSLAEQDAAVQPRVERKVVLATNVAESSVTVAGVRIVVDSGLARTAYVCPWTGVHRLVVSPISQSSAVQRAGRAGREGPGRVLRLFGAGDLRQRPMQDKPELERLELSGVLLGLLGMGIDPTELNWLNSPPKSAMDTAWQLLQRLGAVTNGRLTALGKSMARLPTPPRLARLAVECYRRGIGEEGALAAALMTEGDIRGDRHYRAEDLAQLESGDSDLQERLDRYREAEWDGFRSGSLRQMGLQPARVAQVKRGAAQIMRALERARITPLQDSRETDPELTLRRSLLSAFGDQVALRRSKGRELTLRNGVRARLADSSVVQEGHIVVVLGARQKNSGGPAHVEWVSKVELDWLFEDLEDEIVAVDQLAFDTDHDRVVSISKLMLGSLTLDESRMPASPGEEATTVLYEAALARLTSLWGKTDRLDRQLARVEVLRRHGGSLLPKAALSARELLAHCCQGRTSIKELKELNWPQQLLADWPYEAQQLLESLTPEQVVLPGGRSVTVHYESGKAPWIASRIQDFFGLESGPKICEGRVPLTLHLLAPNGRAAQVTQDLEGFWTRHYSEVRKELRRRYAKHHWPEDGRTAEPTRRGRRPQA